MLAFSMLNTLLLGAEIWVAHLVGPVTSNATDALAPPGKIYLPGVISSAVPLVAWAIVLAVLAFALIEGARWLGRRTLDTDTAGDYRKKAATFRNPLTAPRKYWYWSGLKPFSPSGDQSEDQSGDPGPGQGWEQKIARAQFLGGASHDATWLLWGIVIAQLIVSLCAWRLHIQVPVAIRNIGVLIIGLVLPALMAFLYSAWSDLAKRRTIGVLWDVGTFWPRSYHPLSPPCYTERAVPELQRRMWWLHDNGGRVALVAHSQGAVLATAALVQPGCRPHGDHPALVTFGSPVCKLYSWGFPAYFGPKLIKPLKPGGQERLSDWRNFYYPTDPIGGPVAADLSRADGSAVDQGLLDPAECYYVYGQPPPSPQGHSGYWADPRVWNRINQIAAGGGGGGGGHDPVTRPGPCRPRRNRLSLSGKPGDQDQRQLLTSASPTPPVGGGQLSVDSTALQSPLELAGQPGLAPTPQDQPGAKGRTALGEQAGEPAPGREGGRQAAFVGDAPAAREAGAASEPEPAIRPRRSRAPRRSPRPPARSSRLSSETGQHPGQLSCPGCLLVCQ